MVRGGQVAARTGIERPWLQPGGLWVYLVAGSVGIVATTFAALAVLLWAFFSRHFSTSRLDALLPRTTEIAHLLGRHAPAALLRIASLVRASGGHVWIVGGHGRVLRRYPHTRRVGALAQWVRPAQVDLVLAGHPLAQVTAAHGTAAPPMAVVGVPVRTGSAPTLGARAVFWLAPVGGAAILRAVGTRVAVVAIAGLAVAGTLFSWLAARVTRPVRQLESAAHRIATGDFAVAVAETGPAEIRSLAASLRAMQARLGQVDRQRRDFLADVSHELRSPLTTLRGALEGMRSGEAVAAQSDRYLALALGETARLTRLLDDLLTMARIDAGSIPLHRAPVDIWETVLRIALSLEPVAALKGVTVRFDAPQEAARVDADPDRLSQVLWNLLHNAARHAPPESVVSVAMTLRPSAVAIDITNAGPPIPPDVLRRLFDRFEQGGSAADGSAGLGLAIARTLAAAHGARLTAESPRSGGLCVTLEWPRWQGEQGQPAWRGWPGPVSAAKADDPPCPPESAASAP